MSKNRIKAEYEKLKKTFEKNPMGQEVTDQLIVINSLCREMLSDLEKKPLETEKSNEGKNYIAFVSGEKLSRPVNIDLYNAALQKNGEGKDKIDIFWDNLKRKDIKAQNADDITTAVYFIAISFCCCADLLGSGQKVAGTYFEKLVGHLYAVHLNSNPVNQMTACELDDVSIKIPTDFIFDTGKNKPKFHVPAKTSTRDRVVQVWAQQRVLDGAYGVGRFLCLLTAISETDYDKKKNIVKDICVQNQWINYQLFIAQIKRAYYLDVPKKYEELNNAFPKIHVRKFGQFFHESDELID